MKLLYIFPFIGIGVTCYRITRCLEKIEDRSSNEVLKFILKILFYPLALLSLPYVLVFSWFEIYEQKDLMKKHQSDLRTVKFLTSLDRYPTDAECKIYNLPSPSGYGSFQLWRDKIYDDLGL